MPSLEASSISLELQDGLDSIEVSVLLIFVTKLKSRLQFDECFLFRGHQGDESALHLRNHGRQKQGDLIVLLGIGVDGKYSVGTAQWAQVSVTASIVSTIQLGVRPLVLQGLYNRCACPIVGHAGLNHEPFGPL